MTDFIGRLSEFGKLTPELTLQVVGMVIDGIGTAEEWSGEELDQLGELTQELAERIRGAKEAKGIQG